MPDFQIPISDQNRRRNWNRVRWAVLIALVSASIVGVAVLLPSGPSVARDSLVIATVQFGTFEVRVQAPGTLQPRDERLVTAAVPGTVATVLVQPGDSVRSDSMLIQLANPHLLSDVVSANSALVDAKATLVATDAAIDDTRLTMEGELASQEADAQKAALRAQVERGLEDEEVIAALDYQSTVLDAVTARQQVRLTVERLEAFKESAKAQEAAQQALVSAAATALNEAQQNVLGLEVMAGQAGVVQTVAVSPGQTLDVGAPIAKVASLTDLKAVLDVDPSYAGEIERGQTATIQLNDTAQSKISGVVTRISPSVENGSVEVDAQLPMPLPTGTRPDLDVVGNIDVTTIQHTLSVATPVGVTANSYSKIYKLNDNGRQAKEVAVQLGAASATAIQILSGLQPDDEIIVSDTGSFGSKPTIRIQ